MQLALLTTFAASRKEPLADLLARVHSAIIGAGLGEPAVSFVFSEGPIAKVSSVDRVLKRLPQLERFSQALAVSPGAHGTTRALTNHTAAGTIGDAVDFATLVEVARGVPRSFPFHNVAMHFAVPAFSAGGVLPSVHGGQLPGITVTDSWWVNARQRSLSALTIVDAEGAAKKLPALPDAVGAVLAACGKVKKTVQIPLVVDAAPNPLRPSVPSAREEAIRAVVHDFRARMAEIVDRARLPHDLPSNQDVAVEPLGLRAGPKKPELARAFAPLGYDCSGESGTFTLKRRTAGNLTVELHLDVGTWSNHMMTFFRVRGLADGKAFKGSMILPVTRRAVIGAQYPMGGPDRWRQIVDNLAALVAELDRSFVPAIEAASGPSPDWYKPESAE
jgi:hypothetical protein